MAEQVADSLAENVEHFTSEKNEKVRPTPEGLIIAYISLVIMAILPIIVGSLRSVKVQKICKLTGMRMNVIPKKIVIFLPVLASAVLYGFYMSFKILPKDRVNRLASGYFSISGVIMLAHLLNPVINSLIPAAGIPFTNGMGKNKKGLVISLAIGVWYLLKKHWIANNIFGLAIATHGIELMHLNNIFTGCIFLSGLFFYDIFWVFGTDIMDTVATNLKVPITLMFPLDLITDGLNASNFAVLGMGDIFIPGIFIALLLRFDHSTKRKSCIYFYTTLFAYFLGLIATICAMHVFKQGQPALFYLVPTCMGTPIVMAMLRGELKMLFAYEDHPDPENKVGKQNAKKSGSSNSSARQKKKSKKAK